MSKHTAGHWEIKKSPFEVCSVDHGEVFRHGGRTEQIQ